jgi:hypothetical protein
VVFLVVAVAAVAAATTGPIYLTAANQSVTFATLSTATPDVLGLTLLPPSGVLVSSPASIEQAVARVPGASGPSLSDRYAPPIVTVDVSVNFFDPSTPTKTIGFDIDSRTGVCARLHLIAGRCPVAPDELLLSGRSAAAIHAHVGSHLVPLGTKGRSHALVVVGLYQPGNPNAPYWWGENFFTFGLPKGLGELMDAAFVTPAGAAREAAVLPASVIGQLPLHPSTIQATQIPLVTSELNAYFGSLPSLGLVGTSGLGNIFSAVELQEHQMRTIVASVALELVLLALLVLYQVATSNGAARAGDLEVAELRGLRRRSIALLALREPALLLVVATPVGILVGWSIVALLASHILEPGARAVVGSLALGAAVATFVAGCLAAAFGSRNLIRPSLAREGRISSEHRRRRNAALIDLLSLGLAVAAVVELVSTRSRTAGGNAPLDPLASLTPGVLAIAVGIAGARLLPAAARLVARATRFSPRVALALASRSIMRRSGVARRVLVLVIAIGVLSFSVAGYVLAGSNRQVQASFQAGAPYVLTAHVRPGVNFVTAVEKADPTGSEAMAVVKISSQSPTLAVDSTRLAAIASWPAGTTTTHESVSAIAAYLRPPTAPAVMLGRASGIRLQVRLATRVSPDPQLVLSLFDEDNYQGAVLNLGAPLHPGLNEVGTDLDGACSLVCRLDSISLVWTPSQNSTSSIVAPLVLSALEIQRGGRWVPFDAGLGSPGAWAGLDTGSAGNIASTAQVSASRGQLSATFDVKASSSPPAIGPADLPANIPSVVTSGLASANYDPGDPGIYPASGLDGTEFSSMSRIEAFALPGLGGNGALIDLSLAEREMQGPPAGATFEVWCHARPSAALFSQLAVQGVTVVGTQTAASLLHGLGNTAPALGFDLFVLAAVGAILLALGALVFSIASDSRRRSIEFAALAAVGVPLKVLRRSLFVEQFVIVVVGAALGLAAGLVAGQLSFGLLPEFPPGRAGPLLPSTVGVGAPAAVGAVAAVLVLLLLAGVCASMITMRRVKPENVRQTP